MGASRLPRQDALVSGAAIIVKAAPTREPRARMHGTSLRLVRQHDCITADMDVGQVPSDISRHIDVLYGAVIQHMCPNVQCPLPPEVQCMG